MLASIWTNYIRDRPGETFAYNETHSIVLEMSSEEVLRPDTCDYPIFPPIQCSRTSTKPGTKFPTSSTSPEDNTSSSMSPETKVFMQPHGSEGLGNPTSSPASGDFTTGSEPRSVEIPTSRCQYASGGLYTRAQDKSDPEDASPQLIGAPDGLQASSKPSVAPDVDLETVYWIFAEIGRDSNFAMSRCFWRPLHTRAG